MSSARSETRLRMRVAQMQRDRAGLIEHEVSINQDRNETVRVECQVALSLVSSSEAIDENEAVGEPDLVQKDMREQTDVAGIVVKFDHRLLSLFGYG